MESRKSRHDASRFCWKAHDVGPLLAYIVLVLLCTLFKMVWFSAGRNFFRDVLIVRRYRRVLHTDYRSKKEDIMRMISAGRGW